MTARAGGRPGSEADPSARPTAWTAALRVASASCRSRRRRRLEAGAFVAVRVAAGYLLPLSSNAYLLLGIPLTIAFQLGIRRRPLRELFAAGTSRFALDRRGVGLALVLAAMPGWYAVRSLAGHDPATPGWYVAATAGAACAAFALRVGTVRSMLRSAALPVAVGAVGLTLVYGLLHVAGGTAVPLSAAVVRRLRLHPLGSVAPARLARPAMMLGL